MTTQHHTDDPDDDVINVEITATIERDYRRRNVLEDMWSGHSDKTMSNGAFLHKDVRVGYARDILLPDATEQSNVSDGPRGTRTAYTALARQLKSSLRSALYRVTQPDPGFASMNLTPPPSPARFNKGDAALLKNPDSLDHGELVEIVREYRLFRVSCSNGKYLDEEGDRADYLHCYAVKRPGGEPFPALPHELLDPDGRVRHMRLVQA